MGRSQNAEGVSINKKKWYICDASDVGIIYNMMDIIKMKSIIKGVKVDNYCDYVKKYKYNNFIFYVRFFEKYTHLSICLFVSSQ